MSLTSCGPTYTNTVASTASVNISCDLVGRFVEFAKVADPVKNRVVLCEVEVFGDKQPGRFELLLNSQYAFSLSEISRTIIIIYNVTVPVMAQLPVMAHRIKIPRKCKGLTRMQ